LASGRERPEISLPGAIEDRLRNDRARGVSGAQEKDVGSSYRQDRGAVRQPITVASMILALPTFRHAPSDHWQGYGIK